MPTFSNSRLHAYENCPMQYKLRYVDQVPTPPRESIEAFLGKRVHEALEFLYVNVGKGYKPSLGEIVEHLREAWDREWTDAVHIVRSGETIAGYRNIAERCIGNYYKKHDPFDRGRTAGVELLVTYPLDPERDLHLKGYIDRLVDLGGGHYEIHDYKTGRRTPTQADVDRDRQLALYQMAVTQQLPDVASMRLVWHYLASGKMLVSTRSPDQLRQLREDVIALIETIERATAAGDLPPRVSPLCAWCEYKPVCPAWGGSPALAGPDAISASGPSAGR
jgi:putative RecB family exonuclease